MALTLGTNCGFVTTSPSANPGGLNVTCDNYINTMVDTSPSTAGKIIEIGWYCGNATEEANFEVGLYDDNSGPNNLLYSDRTHAKGTTEGWKKVTVDWDISPNTVYHLAFQLDNTATASTLDYSYDSAYDTTFYRDYEATLVNPFGGSAVLNTRAVAIYAVWEAAAGENIYVNVDDTLKQVSNVYVNVDDAWKEVTDISVNVDDVWKTV